MKHPKALSNSCMAGQACKSRLSLHQHPSNPQPAVSGPKAVEFCA